MERLVIFALILASLLATTANSQAASGPSAASYDHAPASAWFELYEVLFRETPGFSAPVVARTYAYATLALYESLVAAMPERRSWAGLLTDLDALPSVDADLHPVLVANAALAHVTRTLFSTIRPKNALLVDAMEERWREHFGATLSRDDVERAHAQGLAVADAILAWAERDGGHEAHLRNFEPGYEVPAWATWEPTPREVGAPLPPLQPDWGSLRPFARDLSVCAPPPPPAYSLDPSSQLYQEALEVIDAIAGITPEQRETAQYWSDDPGSSATPAGHWFSIARQALIDHEADLGFAAETYARLGVTLHDAFVSCWATKFRELYVRPITYIQRAIDPGWNQPRLTDPLLTPPFPEYTSGHSVVSAAAATVLTSLFGAETPFLDSFHIGRGFDPRHYDSFWEAADEAAYSRLVGGIHFRSGIEHGVTEGRCVAEQLLAIELHLALD